MIINKIFISHDIVMSKEKCHVIISKIEKGVMVMGNEKIYMMKFAEVYKLLVNKAVRKGRTKEEVDEIVKWLTGYRQSELDGMVNSEVSYGNFFQNAPELNENRKKIKGTVCGVRVEEVQEPLMQEIRYLDKLIDELAKGRKMEKILRT